jgi:hypothetical protein
VHEPSLIDFDDGITAVDTEYVRPGLDASHLVVQDGRAAFVDTGTSHSVPLLLATLQAKGVEPGEVDWVFVTHVHLDHAGGAGVLMSALPNATAVLHPRGARHMAEPGRLIEGSKAVYGDDAFDRLYGEIRPIPAERIRTVEDGDRLSLAAGSSSSSTPRATRSTTTASSTPRRRRCSPATASASPTGSSTPPRGRSSFRPPRRSSSTRGRARHHRAHPGLPAEAGVPDAFQRRRRAGRRWRRSCIATSTPTCASRWLVRDDADPQASIRAAITDWTMARLDEHGFDPRPGAARRVHPHGHGAERPRAGGVAGERRQEATEHGNIQGFAHPPGRQGRRGTARDAVARRDLCEGEVVIRGHYSSINYKDALAATGARADPAPLPAGRRHRRRRRGVSSDDERYRPGQAVLVTGCGLSEDHDGGYAEYLRACAATGWCRSRKGLDPRSAMQLGTAGFTAGLAMHRLEHNGLSPDKGPVIVTGATGGVGSLAVDMLAGRGYQVTRADRQGGGGRLPARAGRGRGPGARRVRDGHEAAGAGELGWRGRQPRRRDARLADAHHGLVGLDRLHRAGARATSCTPP